MNIEEIGEKIRERSLEVVLLISGLVLLGAGIFWWIKGREPATKVEILGTGMEVKEASRSASVFVDIAGAVLNPGVYSFSEGSRVTEVIDRAGGLSKDADTNWIDMYLNRSAKVVDGQKIYIPSVEKSQITNNDTQTNSNNQITNNKININTATKGELDTLYGVGQVTADKIINNRPYTRLEELREKKIVTQKVYDQIKDKMSLW